jgi:hypothetical protein
VHEAFCEEIFSNHGGFRFWLGNYNDLFKDPKTNEEAYKFWHKKVLARRAGPRETSPAGAREGAVPVGHEEAEPGEQNFYEVVSLLHVDIVDVHANPIQEVMAEGIRLRDATLVKLDVVAFATGFDSVAGGMAQVHIVGTHGKTIAEHRRRGRGRRRGLRWRIF